MTEKEKIKQYLEYKGISKNKFYNETGLSIGFLDSGNSLGVDKLKIIINKYSDINTDWLITGKGDMLLNSDIKEVKPNSDINSTNSDEDKFVKSFAWLVCSSYRKKTGIDFTFNSFSELAEIFSIISMCTKTLQQTLEVEITQNTMSEIIKDIKINDEGNIIIPDTVMLVIDKYIKIYQKLQNISIDGMLAIRDGSDFMDTVTKEFKRKLT
jgi:hypothetical protein